MTAQIISFKADVNDVTRKMGILGKSISKVESLQKELVTIERQHKRELTNLSSAMTKYGQNSEQVTKIQSRLNDAQVTGASIAEQLAKEEDLLAQQAKQAGVSHNELAQIIDATGAKLEGYNAGVRNSNGNYKLANAGMRSMRGGMAQLGYQVQDVAVQLQMGQNALLVFGQQGSQVASIFGTKGAILGGVLAVAAAITSALVPSLLNAGKALKEFKERLEDAEDKLDDLTLAEKEFAAVQTQKQIDDLQSQIAGFTRTNEAAAEAQRRLNEILAEGNYVEQRRAGDIAMLNGLIKQSTQNNSELRIEFESLNEQLKTQQDRLTRLNGGTAEYTDETKELIEALEEELATIGMTARELSLYEAAQLEAGDATKARINAIYDEIEAEELKQQVIEDNIARGRQLIEQGAAMEKTIRDMGFRTDRQMLLDSHQDSLDMIRDYYDARLELVQQGTDTERKLEQDKQNAINVASSKYLNDLEQLKAKELGIYADGAGGIAAIMKEGSAAQRAALAVQKGLTVASAVMNMHAAIAQANAAAPFPANLPAITMALSQGLAAIAGVRGVSFEGGGFTGMGARAGGIDGRGGFPAILHPNETVYDHTRGQGGQPVNVSFNISTVNAQGFDELLYSRRGQIINMINQAVNNSGRRSIV